MSDAWQKALPAADSWTGLGQGPAGNEPEIVAACLGRVPLIFPFAGSRFSPLQAGNNFGTNFPNKEEARRRSPGSSFCHHFRL